MTHRSRSRCVSAAHPTCWRPGNVVCPQRSPGTCSRAPTPHAPCRRPKIGFPFCSIPPSFVLSHNMQMINITSNWLRFGAFPSPLAPSLRIHWPLAIVLSPHAGTRPTSRFRSCADPSPAGYCLTPTAELAKIERGPISMSDPSTFSMSPNQATPAEKSIHFSPLAAAQPLNILPRPETLNASGSRRACRMAICRNASSLPDFPEFAQAVRYGVLASGKLWKGGRDSNSETFR